MASDDIPSPKVSFWYRTPLQCGPEDFVSSTNMSVNHRAPKDESTSSPEANDYLPKLLEAGSRFDRALISAWQAANDAGVLNYGVENVLTKSLPGKFGIITQLNPARARKRRQPLPFTKLKEPFDDEFFNFTKIHEKELLVNIDILQEELQSLAASLIVNTAPILPCHCLLLPRPLQRLPQVVDRQGLLLATETVLLSRLSCYRVGFNSLCAYASVNHYHYHAYYLPGELSVERAPCFRVSGPCFTFAQHYAPGFVFEVTPSNLDMAVRSAMVLVEYLLSAHIPHNVFITRGAPLASPPRPAATVKRHYDINGVENVTENGYDLSTNCHYKNESKDLKENGIDVSAVINGTSASEGVTTDYDVVRLCIWARESTAGAKDVDVFCPALCELAGHVTVYNGDKWETLSEDSIVTEITRVCFQAYNFVLPKINALF